MHSGCLWLSKEIKLLLARCVGNASRSSFINLPGRIYQFRNPLQVGDDFWEPAPGAVRLRGADVLQLLLYSRGNFGCCFTGGRDSWCFGEPE